MPPAIRRLLSPPRRRGALTALLAVGVVTIAAGWIAAGQTAGADTSVYREAVLGRAVRVSPLIEPANQAEADLAALVFSGLMRLRADGSPEPDLAERWEVTDDRLTYTFHLRGNVTWHDGAAFDAEDVAFTIARIQSESFTGPPALQAQWEDVQVFVEDATTVLVRLPEPAADFLVRATLGIVPEHLEGQMEAGEGFNARPFERSPIGTGPYRLTSFGNDRAVLRHNTSFYRGTPSITEVELRFADSEAQQLEWLRSGAVDAALLPDSLADVDALTTDRDALAVTPLVSDGLTVLYVNNQRGPLTDPRTRAALAASVDTAAAVEAAGLIHRAGTGVIPPDSWLYAASEREPRDPAALWAAAQWLRGEDGLLRRMGQPLTLELVTNGDSVRVPLAEAVAAQLREFGVVVDVVAEPAQRVVSEYLRPGNYDLAMFGWETPPDLDPYTGWHTSQIGAGNVALFSDPEADAILEAARTSLDVAERRELYALFQARFAEVGASVVVSYPAFPYAHPRRLTGFEPVLLLHPSSRFLGIEHWRLAD